MFRWCITDTRSDDARTLDKVWRAGTSSRGFRRAGVRDSCAYTTWSARVVHFIHVYNMPTRKTRTAAVRRHSNTHSIFVPFPCVVSRENRREKKKCLPPRIRPRGSIACRTKRACVFGETHYRSPAIPGPFPSCRLVGPKVKFRYYTRTHYKGYTYTYTIA